MLGTTGLRNVVSLLTLTRLCDQKPRELMQLAYIRGQMSMLLARSIRHKDPSAFFTAGLFSLLDVMFDISLTQVLDRIPLEEWVVDGLLNNEGVIGEVLNCVRAYERGQFENAHLHDLDNEAIGRAYLQSIQIANSLKA
jgi:c-di-GMP phosphodiesterase